jgi:hypothetical protein
MNTKTNNNNNVPANQTARRTMHRIVFLGCGLVLALAFAVLKSQSVRAGYMNVSPPDVPAIIQVPAGNQLFRVGHAIGT